MFPRLKLRVGLLLTFALLQSSIPAPALAQSSGQNPPPSDEVLRISSELVQTDVVVLDKQGRAVPGLGREQFELTVDGQPQPVLFFEGVEAGGAAEAAKLAAARGGAGSGAGARPTDLVLPGRSFIFLVDDLHLGQASVQRTRVMLERFIAGMAAGDQAMIVSPSGSIGFLQQLTDNKAALKLAASRINHQPQTVASSGRRAMTVYEARAIDRGDRGVLDYKIKEVMDDMGLGRNPDDLSGSGMSLGDPQPAPNPTGTPGAGGARARDTADGVRVMDNQRESTQGTNLNSRRKQAEAHVKNEARRILLQSNSINSALFSSLESLARGSASLPGRKLIFLISDGFVFDTRESDAAERLQRVTDSAARSGVAIYTLDSRGLTADFASADKDAFSDIEDVTGGLDSSTSATSLAVQESSATKEILRTLAENTGGRAILNRNDLEAGLRQVVNETASYYVLAWKPTTAEVGKPKFKALQVSIKGRPELRVLSRRGFYSVAPPPLEADKKAADTSAKTSDAELRAILTAPFVRRQMMVASYAGLTSEPAGGKVAAIVDLSGYTTAAGADGKAAGEVDFVAVVFDDTGKSVTSVGQKLTPPEDKGGAKPFRVMSRLPNALKPGLYQLRVAARDVKTGRVGSSFHWLEVPESKPGKMTLSSLFLTEEAGKEGMLEVERRFARASNMLVQLYVYNAAQGAGGQTDVTVTLQILQGEQVLTSAPPQPLAASGDPTRLQYSVSFPLANFPAGTYALQLLVEDRTGKTNATRKLSFSVE